MDIKPTSHGHILIIPKYHAARLHEVSDQFLTDILPIAKRFAKALNLQAPDVGYNLLQNNGKIASQEVEHVHFHFIPKPHPREGLVIGWPSQDADMATLKTLQEQIRHTLEEQ